ncbi:MAG: Ldh family oxidoreductase [Planctomycetota bacterium]|jgi:LDH2 family malate/lactate/ureidoglycolate dehydrogenase|nr:Ldh family oxidoreductase [Planctomycetota bacterium]
MKALPKEFTRVSVEDLTKLTREIYLKVGMSDEDATVITDLLVHTDLRGVFSHGTRQTRTYATHVLNGNMNPTPELKIVQERPTTVVIDGDGGLGHMPCHMGTEMAIAKAKEFGLGAVTTRNHHHFGSAGKYTHMIIKEGCAGFSVSSHYFKIEPAIWEVTNVGGGSPMSFGFPHRDQPPLLIDMSINMLPAEDELKKTYPVAFFKTLGLGATCAALAKILSGVSDLYHNDAIKWPASNQGSFILAIDIESFLPMDVFLREMDAYTESAHQCLPMAGQDRALLPGNMEHEYEQEWRRIGIPVGTEHQNALTTIAEKVGVETPWA